MLRWQTVMCLLYLPVHMFLLPSVLPAYLAASGVTDPGQLNFAYYALGIMFMFATCLGYLRAEFDPLVERLGHCVLTFFMALGIDYILSLAVNSVVLAVTKGADNPNEAAVMDLVAQSENFMRAVAIFMAPMVEELLFRGALFGCLRKRNRILAYAVSIAFFALYHVWDYVAQSGDWRLFIYMLQYVPVGIALTWAYERSGSLWVSIGFHATINYMSLAVEKMAAELM